MSSKEAAAKVKTVYAAIAAAEAVFEARVVTRLVRGGDALLEARLHDLEMAYYRRADALKSARKKAAKR